MPITELLSAHADSFGDEVSLVEVSPESGDRRLLTWREFDAASNRLANALLSRGIGRGKKVAILMTNCLEWLPIYFGILKTGALAVPMNYRYLAEEIAYCLNLAETDALVFGPEFVARVEPILDKIPQVRPFIFVGADTPAFAESYEQLIATASTAAPAVPITDSNDAAIYFSSGTTGFPKAILHDHRSLMSSCETEQNHHGQTRDDNFLCIPPLYHTGAKMHWFGSLLVGGKAVLLRGVTPEWIIDTVSKERCTIVWLLVPWAQDILDAIDRGEIKLENYRLEQWRLMHIGAQPVPPSLIRRWKERFPHHQYDTNYGLSESIGPGCVHLGVENIHKVGAIGKAGHLWDVKIVDAAGEATPQGEVGELAVKGPGVMKGYYRDPEATAAALKDGRLLTGDMARMDQDGFIWLVDRKKDVIITGGENIYPIEIEDFLHQHDAIKDVAVIGLPDQRLGEIVGAVIELKTGAQTTEEEILEFCTALPRYKRPRVFIFNRVPRNPTGKIEKVKLREKYAGGSVVEAQLKV
ncbi:MAG: AMP-binding protein [Actinobacteria bacterium]|nr:AMP-binding protein [Actinomycetota bacterium]